MTREPWTIIVNADDGTPKADDFDAGHYEMTSDVVEDIYRQLYGMIWWMAKKTCADRNEALAMIKNARENSDTGVGIGEGAWFWDIQPMPNLAEVFQGIPGRMFGPGSDTRPATPEHPIYKKVKADVRSNFWMITCDEGWRTLIVCTDLYENVADWMLGILGRTPYAKKAS